MSPNGRYLVFIRGYGKGYHFDYRGPVIPDISIDNAPDYRTKSDAQLK